MWNDNINEAPKDKLILVKQAMAGVCLRRQLDSGEWFDENNNYDDSELEIYEWCEIPE